MLALQLTQHISLFDYVCAGASLEGRMLEYVDHLHDHFLDPVRMRGGRYVPPEQPGYSAAIRGELMRPASISFAFSASGSSAAWAH